MSSLDLQGQILIAMPQMPDPRFAGTCSLVCEHNADGAFALTINRSMGVSLAELLEQLDLDTSQVNPEEPVLLGGPVDPQRGFVLHEGSGDWQHTQAVGDDLWLTSSRDILAAIAEGNGPARRLTMLGYAGWGADQLAEEMKENSWLSANCTAQLLFEEPLESRWAAATRSLGIDPAHLPDYAGHA